MLIMYMFILASPSCDNSQLMPLPSMQIVAINQLVINQFVKLRDGWHPKSEYAPSPREINDHVHTVIHVVQVINVSKLKFK